MTSSAPSPLPSPAPLLALPSAAPPDVPSATPAQVLSKVAKDFGLTLAQLRGRGTTKWVVRARVEASFQLRALGLSLSEVGLQLDRDHTTILYLLRKRPS